jgi:hypothetical protein
MKKKIITLKISGELRFSQVDKGRPDQRFADIVKGRILSAIAYFGLLNSMDLKVEVEQVEEIADVE